MKERTRHVVIKCDDTELAQLHAIADANDEPIARAIRRFIAVTYKERFGDGRPPKPKPKTRRS
jgi:hypothetical protein